MSLALLPLIFLMFIDWMSIGLVYPMFSSMLFHKEMVFFEIEASSAIRTLWLGILLSIGPLAQFFSAPILGTLCDFKGRKPIMIGALIGIIAGYGLSIVAVWQQSLFGLLAGRMIVGIGSASGAVISAAVADLSTLENKAKNFGLLSMACGVGFMLGPFIAGHLSSWGGFDKPFLFAALASLFNLFLVIAWYSETYTPSKMQRQSLGFSSGLKHIQKALLFPGLSWFFVTLFIFCVGWSFYWEFIPVTWMGQYGLNPLQVSNFYAYGAAVYAFSSAFLVQPVVKRFHLTKVLLGSFAGLSLSILILLFHSHVDWFWIYVPLQQYFLSMIYPTITAIISNCASKDSQGEAMGITHSVQAFGFATSPLLAGVFAGLSYQMPILVGGLALVVAGSILATGHKLKRTKVF